MGISPGQVARVLGIETTFKDLRAGGVLFLPQRLAIIGQGSSVSVYSLEKTQVTNSGQVAEKYGYGSPLHLAVKQIFPSNGDGVGTIPVTIYPMDDSGSGVAATGTITPVVAQTVAAAYTVVVNNIRSNQFVIPVGATVAAVITSMTAAINAVLEMPVIAVDATPGTSTTLDLTAKWKGISGNDVFVAIEGSLTAGTTFGGVGKLTGGLVNPTIDAALALMGDIWESMILNCLNIEDTLALDALNTFGEGRWGELVKKPLIAFTGITEKDVADAILISAAKTTQRSNCQLVEPGGVDLPCVVAAREIARIIVVANEDPAHDYGSQDATGLIPGADEDQWDLLQQQQAVLGGSSTINIVDGVVTLADTITFYNPTAEEIPAYRYVCDIVKLQNVIFNLNLIFANKSWDGAPLIPNEQATTSRTAKKPKMAVAEVAAMIDSLALEALISDPVTAKANTAAQIDSQNPKRLNVQTIIQLAGNTNVIDVELGFGFYFGSKAIVA